MVPAGRSSIIIALAAVTAMAVTVLTVTAGRESAIEVGGEAEPAATTLARTTPTTDAAASDWGALLGPDDAETGDAADVDSPPFLTTRTAGSAASPDASLPTASTSVVPADLPTTTVVASSSAGFTTTTVAVGPPSSVAAGSTTTTQVDATSTTVKATSTTRPPTTATSTTTSSTTTSSTTTSTSTTTTTAAVTVPPTTEPTLAPFTRTFHSSGGSITVTWDGSSLSLVSVNPDRRHRASVLAASGTMVSVRFIGRDDSSITVRVIGSTVSVDIR